MSAGAPVAVTARVKARSCGVLVSNDVQLLLLVVVVH